MSDDRAPTDERQSDEPDLPEQLRIRRAKYDRLLEAGIDPYPVAVERTTSLANVRGRYPNLAADSTTGEIVGITGRVIFIRNTGKLCFATVREAGVDLQVMLSLDQVGADALAAWKADVDLGDNVFARGEVISSRRGELSVLADSWAMTAKALRPLPVAHKAMSEESRVRARYVDLIMRPEAREMVQLRYKVVRSLRESFAQREFIEVETPMLQVIHGGATARPFVTHINAYDIDLYLRIAPELFLKRCVVGGLDRVFEINRNFRNEGADSTHSPEFAMLEAYEAYGDYTSIGDLTQSLIQQAALDSAGTLELHHPDGTELNLSGDWPKMSLYDLVSNAVGEVVTPQTSRAKVQALAAAHSVEFAPHAVTGKIVEALFEDLVEATLIQPTFVRDYPLDTSPLVRAHRTEAGKVEKFDLYIKGMELATGYSELVDPVVQRQRLVEQSLAAAGGDLEAMALDEDFLAALEYGMPPTGGMGMGIDRLLSVITGRGIRDTILFPLVKPVS
ncbi:MAG: lysyl-tRNA synthetase [Pseudonocardiales bacterium]|nr:lysyl-tRNA synthetase [Jatrophihabitantaceae bacterium]MCW2604565.1 lysyl-tRNA synthetase [Pseudonocardiales bacterium]